MKITTGTALRLLREANPAPDDAFLNAAQDTRLRGILGSSTDSDVVDFGMSQGAGTPAGQRRWRPEPLRPRWRAAIRAATLTAAVAATLAVVLLLSGNPVPGNPVPASPPAPEQAASGTFVELVANLTAHPSASQGDASAELRTLAGIAATQPAPAALGPVEYSKAESWGLDLGTTHYGLSYRSHDTNTQESWMGSDGAYLGVETWPGKIPPGIIPVQRSGPSARGAAGFATWYDPARLPTSEPAMRQHLLGLECSLSIACSGGDATSQIVTGAETLMGSEPLPPAARAAILRALADTAANPGSHQAFFDLGSVTDRAGHQAVAIAYEKQQDLTLTQGAAPGASCTTRTSGGRTTVTCTASGSASVSPSAPASGSASGSTSGTASGSASGKPSGTSGPGVSVVTQGSTGKGHLPAHFMESSLVVLVFDPGTAALLGEEYAYCNAPVEARLAIGSCFATSYDQFLEITAVQSIPATPTAAPDTPPSGPAHTLPTNTP
jgi:hypothetical protein